MKRENKKVVDEVLKDLEVLETHYVYIVKYMYNYNMREFLTNEEADAAKVGDRKNFNIYFLLNINDELYSYNNSVTRHLENHIPFELIKSMILMAKINIEKEIKEKEQLLKTL